MTYDALNAIKNKKPAANSDNGKITPTPTPGVGSLTPTNFGQSQSLSQQLQQNSQVKGSYGNWGGQKPAAPQNSITSQSPIGVNPKTPLPVGAGLKSAPQNTNIARRPLQANPQAAFPRSQGANQPYPPRGIPYPQPYPYPNAPITRQYFSTQAQDHLRNMIEGAKEVHQSIKHQIPTVGQPPSLPPSNGTQISNPNNQPRPNNQIVAVPEGKTQLPTKNTTPKGAKTIKTLDKNSVEYLRTLTPSDLRREVIKTEIEIQKALIETEKAYQAGVTNIRDLISPSGINIMSTHLELNTKLVRSFFILTYPRVISSGWLEGLVNADMQLDISIFVYPRDSGEVLRELRGKVGKIQASLQLNSDQGKARDPQLETAYRDVEGLRDAIQQGVEKFFRVAVYIQIYANTMEELEKTSQTVEGILSQQNIITKRSALQMDDGFNASLPILKDDLDVVTNMNTSPLSACFPFVSSDLSSDSGILYGINRHNSSLIIFDRFELENANSLVFATSGAGKSYAVKLEILRSRMLGVGVIVIDPEQEYKVLADSLGGVFINFSLNSTNRINPFDLPKPLPGESTADIIRSAIIDLMGLMNLMLGKLNPTEVSIMEKAIQEAYAKKDITPNSDLSKVTPPTMSDLVEILQGIVGGDSLAQRLYRYTEGTFAGIFNKPTNINIDSDFIVFSIRDLQETLRPIAMYILLKYVWTEIRSELKKRILAIDEAWILMQYEDSARFLYGLAKRARKYYLGITTISQDVTDFLSSPLGKPIVTNAAMKLLLKQSSAAIDQVADTFALTSGEKQVLLQSEVGQGIFFAGPRHVAIEIIAFPTEHKIITTNPKDVLKSQGLE